MKLSKILHTLGGVLMATSYDNDYAHAAVSIQNELVALQKKQEEKNKRIYYQNQEDTACKVADSILNTDIFFQIVVARTQVGKTGCMISIIEECIKNIVDSTQKKRINPENIFVITGLSSNDWKSQNKSRFPQQLHENIYHRNDLRKKLLKKIKGKKDVLILIDEVHFACGEKQTISKMLEDLEYKETQLLIDNNINFVEFSATPKNVMHDHREWIKKGHADFHTMESGVGYRGPKSLLDDGRAFQFKKLDSDGEDRGVSMNAIREIKEKISETYRQPKFHIIRAPKGENFKVVKDRFSEIFGEEYDYIECTANDDHSFNDIMRNGADESVINPEYFPPPKKHTFIFIKELLRCAHTIEPKKHVGVLYERIASKNQEHVVVQGLGGRACGYDVPDHMIVYTDIPSLENYEKDWETDYQKVDCPNKASFASRDSYDVDPNAPLQKKKKNRASCPIVVIPITGPTPITETGRGSFKKAKEMFKTYNPDLYTKYKHFDWGCWVVKNEASKTKWRIETMLTTNAMSTITNIKAEKLKTDKIICYIYENKLICQPWNGSKNKKKIKLIKKK